MLGAFLASLFLEELVDGEGIGFFKTFGADKGGVKSGPVSAASSSGASMVSDLDEDDGIGLLIKTEVSPQGKGGGGGVIA